MSTRSPNTFVVGAGPVATALASAWRRGGVPVLGVWARRATAARAAAATAGVAAFSSAPPDLILNADVIVLAVRDDAIAAVAQMLVGTGLVTRHHVLLHCAGALAAEDVFAGVRDAVGGVGTLHPLRAIVDGKVASTELRGAYFGVEGDERGRVAATALVHALGALPIELDRSQMAGYHTAAAMASNYVVALIDLAAQILVAGAPRTGDASHAEAHDAAVRALVPLAQGALANVAAHGTAAGLTGPVRRGDVATVERHLAVVDQQPSWSMAYRTLAQQAVTLVRSLPADTANLPTTESLDALQALLTSTPVIKAV